MRYFHHVSSTGASTVPKDQQSVSPVGHLTISDGTGLFAIPIPFCGKYLCRNEFRTVIVGVSVNASSTTSDYQLRYAELKELFYAGFHKLP